MEIKFWRSSTEQCAFTNVLRRFATVFAILGDHQALARQYMLPKGMEEVETSLRRLMKVSLAFEEESVVKLEGGGQWVST